MGSMEWPRTDYPEPQPPRRLGWLEAAAWITCIDPVLTLPTQAEDFTKRRQAHEIIEVAADYSRRSTAWAQLCCGHESKTKSYQTATIAPSTKISADAVTDLPSRESTILDEESTVKMTPHSSC